MSGFLARMVFPVLKSRDPVFRWLHLLRTLQHCALLQSNTTSVSFHTTHRKYLHMSSVQSKMKDPEDRKNAGRKTKVAYLKSHMTVTELAQKLHVPLDDVLTSLVLITEEEYQPGQEVKDVKVLEKVAMMLKRSYKIVNMKKSKNKKVPEKNSDFDKTETGMAEAKMDEKLLKRKIEEQTENKDRDETDKLDVEKQPLPESDKLVYRPPVVTIMGHVDHGKTTLLDALRESNVVDQEFGGITQHIGAFNVRLESGHSITFLDTPGHAAFSAMRARGASVTDIVVLMIAAEDGIMPQTVESIRHAQAANVPIIVAINKIDKPGVNISKIPNLLSMHGIHPESFGGDTQIVPISALKRINLDKLQECITTLAEYLDLKGDPVGMVEGRIIEIRTEIGRGKLATILVQRGTLKKGDLLLSGTTWTKVRQMYDSNGQVVQTATLSMPVVIGGWKELPLVGDEVIQVKTERRLKKALQYRLQQKNVEKEEETSNIIQERRSEEREQYNQKRKEKLEFQEKTGLRYVSIDRFEQLKNRGRLPVQEEEDLSAKPMFRIIVKGDVAGSVEAILNTLATFRSELCDLDIMHSGVGEVTENDIELAELFDGEIYAFNVGVVAGINTNKVKIKSHNVIYRLFEDLVETINKILPDITEEQIIGEGKILQEFVITAKVKDKKMGIGVAGCRCMSGKFERNQLFKVIRGDEIIYNGNLDSLKHCKNETDLVKSNQECGICFSKTKEVDFKAGDTVICYKNISKRQTLDWEPAYLDNSFLGLNQNRI